MTKEVDPFRDSSIRYLGYANEVGEAFRPLIPRVFVNASYAISISYVCGDVLHKSLKMYKKDDNVTKAGIAAVASDVFLWQMLASVIVPGLTINRITWGTARLLKQTKLPKQMGKILPSALGFCSIPFIIHPIDKLVDCVLDSTYRKWIEIGN